MPEVNLGVASDLGSGDRNARIVMAQNRHHNTPSEKDLVISGPHSIEFSVNTNLNYSQEADKIYFSTHRGSSHEIVAILASNGDLFLRGDVYENQGDLGS
jgi:hypothetical protein